MKSSINGSSMASDHATRYLADSGMGYLVPGNTSSDYLQVFHFLWLCISNRLDSSKRRTPEREYTKHRRDDRQSDIENKGGIIIALPVVQIAGKRHAHSRTER